MLTSVGKTYLKEITFYCVEKKIHHNTTFCTCIYICHNYVMMMSWYLRLPQWMGSSSVFAPVESMPDHVTLTKYNALVHRAQHEKQAKVC